MIVIDWKSVFLVIGTLAGIVLLVFFQNRLSNKDKPWWGLIPMAVLLILFAVTSAAVLQVNSGNTIHELTVDMKDGNYARMYVRENKAKEIIAYSEMKIYNSQGKQIDNEDIYVNDLTDPESLRPYYADIFEEMTEGKKLIAGYAQEEEVVKDPSRVIFCQGGTSVTINIKSMWKVVFYLGLPLLVVYILKRRQVNAARQAEELRKMEIESL